LITISNLDNSFHTFIYSISLTTFLDGCAALVEQVKALYSNDPALKCGDIVGAPDADNLDRINRMDRINASNPVNPVHPVQTVASQSAAPDSQKILEFIGARLLRNSRTRPQ
jgi:hypothetical protein